MVVVVPSQDDYPDDDGLVNAHRDGGTLSHLHCCFRPSTARFRCRWRPRRSQFEADEVLMVLLLLSPMSMARWSPFHFFQVFIQDHDRFQRRIPAVSGSFCTLSWFLS